MKCQKCEHLIGTLQMREITLSALGAHDRRGLAIVCPFCDSLLSVAIDPISVKADIVNAVEDLLKRHQ